MTREEAREELIEEWNEFIDGCGLRGIEEKEAKRNPDFKKVCEANLMAIQALEQEPKWIPVSERLPEFSIEVLTCSNGGFIEIQSLEESNDCYWENQKGDWSDFDEIIAWMPLPEPYKAGKER